MEINLFSLAIFLVLFIISLSSIFHRSIFSQILFGLGLLVYCALIALRGDSGSDTFIYRQYYENRIDFEIFPEPGLSIIFNGFNLLGAPFQFFLLFQSVICFFSLIILRKTSGSSAVIFYIIFFGLNIDFSTLRQSVALHLLIIFGYYSKGMLLPFLASSIHFAALASALAKISTGRLLVLIVPLTFIAYFYFSRYISLYSIFLIRDGYAWMMQTSAIVFYLIAKGYSILSIIGISLISYIPIGYRLIAFIFPFMAPKFVHGRRDIVVAIILVLVSPIKLESYSSQSILNDGDRSIILHYNDLFR